MVIVSEGNWLEADELQPVRRQEAVGSSRGLGWARSAAALQRESLWGRRLQPLHLVVVWGCGRFFQCRLGFFFRSLGLPNDQLTFSLSICSLFVEPAAV